MAFALHAQFKHYDWGIPGALSTALGHEPSGKPEAELWWGNHPLAECSITAPEGVVDFPTWLDTRGISFPLLAKLLAAKKPLSIQVHPSEEQAQRGFEREQAEGISLDARERTYKDRSAKPELIIALSEEFVGLAGFAKDTVVRTRLARWSEWGAPHTFLSLMTGLVGDIREAARVITHDISGDDLVIQELNTWLAVQDTEQLGTEAARDLRLLQKVSAAYPGDPGILFVPLMHHVTLKRGEALFVAAGEVHAYVEGLGLEVMLPSDNVVRAGLTSKHTDIAAFLELSDLTPSVTPRIVHSEGDELSSVYEGFGANFAVHCLRLGSGEFSVTKPSLCFVESGEAIVRDSEATTIGRGSTVFALPGETISPESEDAVVWIVHSTKD